MVVSLGVRAMMGLSMLLAGKVVRDSLPRYWRSTETVESGRRAFLSIHWTASGHPESVCAGLVTLTFQRSNVYPEVLF